MRNLRRRLETAIRRVDVGVPDSLFKRDPRLATNMALRRIGRPHIRNFDSRAEVLRAVIFIEEEGS